jgi:predicted glycosyltransferase
VNKVWIDVRTPKQALIAATLYRELMKEGFKVLVTARNYDYTVSNLERNNVKHIVVGGYGSSLKEKLVVELERALKLIDIIEWENPCLLLSYPSPSAARVAFGLGLKHIALCDTPHAFAANRLDFPFADVAVFSSFIADEMIWSILEKFTSIATYRGVDELLWIKKFRPDPSVLSSLEVKKYEYVVIRPEEYKAHYYPTEKPMVLKLIDTVVKAGYTPVVLPRYKDQLDVVSENDKVVVPKKAVDGPSLEKFAALVVTGGGTMAREAALLGTPGISLFPRPIKQDSVLKNMGFPIYNLRREEALEFIKQILADPEKYRVETGDLLERMESPLPVIVEWINRLCQQS